MQFIFVSIMFLRSLKHEMHTYVRTYVFTSTTSLFKPYIMSISFIDSRVPCKAGKCCAHVAPTAAAQLTPITGNLYHRSGSSHSTIGISSSSISNSSSINNVCRLSCHIGVSSRRNRRRGRGSSTMCIEWHHFPKASCVSARTF